MLLGRYNTTQILSVLTILLLTACGGGSSPVNTSTQQSFSTIENYSQNPDPTKAPSVDDYHTLGIESVTSSNIADVNLLISRISHDNVDTQEEIEDTLIKREDALAVIMDYVSGSSNVAPTVETYRDLSITGVTEANLDEMNRIIAGLTSDEVDTIRELLGIVPPTPTPTATPSPTPTPTPTATPTVTPTPTPTPMPTITPTPTPPPAPVVNLKPTSLRSSILENGDSVDLNLTLSETVDTDTTVTLSFSSSTAQAETDFKLRYQQSHDAILVNQNNETLVIIPAGKLSVKITLYSVYDCLDEGLESIKVQIKDVSNQITLGEDISISMSIEDNTYDESFYYVSTDGVAGNDGSCSQPFTLAHGLYYLREAKNSNPEKTTLVLKEGVYRDINASFVLRSGTAEHPIVIRAEYPDKVFFVGQRTDAERDGSDDYGLLIQEASYVTIKDISFANYGIGIRIYDSDDTDASPTSHITVENCTITDNGHEGIEVVRSSHVTIKNSYFMGSIPAEDSRDWEGNLCDSLCAIQDYSVAVYGSNNTDISDNIFVGRHHQVVSFKEGDTNGSVERNIFVGALYTAIYLGQNYVYDNPKSTNLTARYNIVMDAEGFPVKSPLRIDNVEGVTVAYNYFKDFDYSNNLSGILVLNRATGTITINNNILAFGINNHNSGAFEIDDDDGCPSAETSISITDNIAYKVHHLLTENGCSNQAALTNNQAYKLFINDPAVDEPNDPVEQNLSVSDYGSLYQQLTQPILDYASGQ